MQAVRKFTDIPWVLLYIERWLHAPMRSQSGELQSKEKGTPQGSVISPLIANIFMHHAFDTWISKAFPRCPYERYADDFLVHCRSREEAETCLAAIKARLKMWKLDLHPEKTKVVYCQDEDRTESHPIISFDFLGYGFRPREVRTKMGRFFVGFNPAIRACRALFETYNQVCLIHCSS